MVPSRFSRVLSAALLLAWLPAVALAAVPGIQDVNQAFHQGNNAAALEKVNAFLAANPKDAQGRFLKGLILTELNRYNDAIKVFTDLTEDYPELPEPYNNLAVLYAAQGQYERAKNSLEMAISTHPSYATAHENLGDIYAKMASQSYDKALQLDKSNTSAQTKLAMIRELFSPAHATEAGKGKPAKGGANKALAQTTNPPPEPARPAPPPPRKPEEAAKPTAPPADAGKAVDTPAEKAAEKPAAQPVETAAGKTVDKAAAVLPPKATVEQTVHAWAEAWSKRDVDTYLAFYGTDFKMPGSLDRAAWEAERKERLSRASFIKVTLDRIKVKARGAQARVTFTQHYASNLLKSKGRKTLLMARQGDAWKIVEER